MNSLLLLRLCPNLRDLRTPRLVQAYIRCPIHGSLLRFSTRTRFRTKWSKEWPALARGAWQPFRLLGIGFGITPHIFRLAQCRQKTRIGHLPQSVSILSSPSVSWTEFWSLIRPYFRWLLFAAVAATLVAFLNIQIPILLGQLVNHISHFLVREQADLDGPAPVDLTALRPIVSKLVLSYLGQALATFLCITSLSWMGERMSADLRVRLFSHLLNFPMPFFDAQLTGELTDRLNNDVQEFKSCFKNCTVQGLRTLAQTLGCCISLYLTSPQMTLVTVGTVPFVIALGALFGALLRRLSWLAQAQNGVAAGVAVEAFQNIRTVKMFAMEEAETGLYQREVENARSLNERLGVGIGLFQAVSNLFLNGLVLGVLYGGGQLMAANVLSPGDLVSFLATAQTIQRSLAQLSLVYGNWLKANASCARVMEFLRFCPIYARGGSQRIPSHSLAGEIRFSDVHFAYATRPEREVLRGVDLCVKGGQTVAICGPSGAGKSTIAALIGHLYEPLSGQVTLDGIEVSQLDPVWLRRDALGVISQEPMLFSTSIRENIRYGRPDASDKEVHEAAQLANAADFIEQFPHGYDTVVGERGVTLSGGQKQRIAIARALVKNPPILILDEATSALDTENERLVQQAMGRVMRDRTVVVIAHRLSTIQRADWIYVLREGRVVEQGTHDQLVRQREGLYRRLVREEREQEEDGRGEWAVEQ